MQKRSSKIVYVIAGLFLMVCCSVYAFNTSKSCPPNNVMHGLANNFTETFTEYEELKRVDVTKLSPDAKQQFLNVLAVYDNCDEKSKMKFITEFPNTFHKYFEIFHYTEEDPGHFAEATQPMLDVLEFTAGEYPKQSVNLLVTLSSEAEYQSDNPGGWLQPIFTDFFVQYPDLTIPLIKRLSLKKQKNIASFLADVETIRTYPAYQKILDILKSRNETRLYDIFLEAKKNKIAELKREHM